MTRAVVFLAVAMVAASLGVVAQDISGGAPNQNPNSAQNNGDSSARRTVTVTGCLSSSASGAYSLADEHGTIYALSGSTSSLSSHVAQQVEVAGQQAPASNASSGTSGVSTIQITTSRVVGDHCNSNVSTSRGSSDSNMAQGAIDLTENNGQLPQTSTVLPLLGLIGLGSLVAGFFARH
jgi:hypothetical protein